MHNNIRKLLAAISIAAVAFAHIPGVRAEERAREAARTNAIDNWQIGATDLGCYMATASTRGTILLVGTERRAGRGFVVVGNESWRAVTRMRKYPLALEFNDGTRWSSEAAGLAPGALYMSFDKPNFLVDFATKKSITVWSAGQYVTTLPLAGSLAALEELARCEEADGRGYRSSDPFNMEGFGGQWKPGDSLSHGRAGSGVGPL